MSFELKTPLSQSGISSEDEIPELNLTDFVIQCKANSMGSYNIICEFFNRINSFSSGEDSADAPAFQLIKKLAKAGGDSNLNALSVGISFCETCSKAIHGSNISGNSKSDAAAWISILAVKWSVGVDFSASVSYADKKELRVKVKGCPSAILEAAKAEKLIESLLSAHKLKETGILVSAIVTGSNDNSTVGSLNTAAAVAVALLTPENILAVKTLAQNAEDDFTDCCLPLFKCCRKKKK